MLSDKQFKSNLIFLTEAIVEYLVVKVFCPSFFTKSISFRELYLIEINIDTSMHIVSENSEVNRIKSWWNNLLIYKKMYLLCGVMGILISFELFILVFSMGTISPLRALVAGEGRWSKSQKNALIHLQEFASMKDEKYFHLFEKDLEVPLALYQARIELEKPQVNVQSLREFLLKGDTHENDIDPVITLLVQLNNFPFLKKAVQEWREADSLLFQIINHANAIRTELDRKNPDPSVFTSHLTKVSMLNNQLTDIENSFSATLGEGSRWLEKTIILVLFFVVLFVEIVIFYLVFKFCEKFTLEIKKLNQATIQIGSGDFSGKLVSQSEDELGQMTTALNKMVDNLKTQISERKLAEHANQIKNLFLANISHEIRTPLNSILGFNEVLRDSNLTAEERQYYLDIVKRTGMTLTSIINDILDLSKIEAEQLSIEPRVFSLYQLLDDVYLTLNLKCQEKGLYLNFERTGSCAEFIYSDPIRIRQILTNVIGNAIKFTDKGAITLRYLVHENQLIFSVKDTGIGIEPERVSKLFVPFSQGDESIRKRFGGTGLGLVISKKLAQLLGGDVEIMSSRLNYGSEFRISISYVPGNQAQITNKPDTNIQDIELNRFRGRSVLVVEDTTDNQVLIKIFLAKMDLQLSFVNNGEEALQIIDKKSFDVILMDMQMPILDGYSAVRQIRAKKIFTPVIAMTGYSMKGDRQKCLDSGCDFYISKPFSKADLVQAIYRSL